VPIYRSLIIPLRIPWAQRHRQRSWGLLHDRTRSLYLLAAILDEMGDVLGPRGIVATSMMLLQLERQVIERVLARP
jgi:hypothetical protein